MRSAYAALSALGASRPLASAAGGGDNAPMSDPELMVRHLGHIDYESCWQRMKTFTAERGPDTADELWVVEHPSVFTLGQAGRPEHVLNPGDIPVVQSDRGGQVTWHGPGQTVIYLLLELRRHGLGARSLVRTIEAAVVDYLASLGVEAAPRPDAPGVYVDGAKIAALGLRIRNGRSYHGLAFNRAPDLSVFERINPCGHQGQPVTSLLELGLEPARGPCERGLLDALARRLRAPLRAPETATFGNRATPDT